MIFSRPFFWGCVGSLGEERSSAEEKNRDESQSCTRQNQTSNELHMFEVNHAYIKDEG